MLTIEEQLKDLPTLFPVAVIMQRSPSIISKWSEYQWQAVGITATDNNSEDVEWALLIYEQGETRQYLYRGFYVRLQLDECESYYHNLMSPKPRGYVVTRENEDGIPIPFLVSMSFDEAHAYLEGDEEVYDVDIPPELYRWVEAYVLAHYVAVKHKKRKRQDWKKPI